ncbi:cytochrome P450 4C1-like isoform X1 [Vespula maculifrons]|uniref:Cytochrome P450 4C1-like isoform X1 n=1 Tax=Vespula maculifrons TaxID=7453 RepID=A0ABD2CX93_VESMC
MNEVYEELNQIYGSCDWKHVPIMHDDIKDMKFLERAIKEILLLYSVIAIIARKVTQDVEVIKNWTIPKGSSADLFNYNLHCNEKYWILLLMTIIIATLIWIFTIKIDKPTEIAEIGVKLSLSLKA